MLNDQDFLGVIDATPLVSIDLIIKNAQGQVLLGLRNNKPAQGYWFVPGGRVRKNERLKSTFQRLCRDELVLDIGLTDARLLGAYEHIYEDNFLNSSRVNTHYVVLGYELVLDNGVEVNLDDQHSDQRWWSLSELLASDKVHDNTKAYFE